MKTIDDLPQHLRTASKLTLLTEADFFWFLEGVSEEQFYARLNTVLAIEEQIHAEFLQNGRYGQATSIDFYNELRNRVYNAFVSGRAFLPKAPITPQSLFPAPVRKAHRPAYLRRNAAMRNSLGGLGR